MYVGWSKYMVGYMRKCKEQVSEQSYRSRTVGCIAAAKAMGLSVYFVAVVVNEAGSPTSLGWVGLTDVASTACMSSN